MKQNLKKVGGKLSVVVKKKGGLVKDAPVQSVKTQRNHHTKQLKEKKIAASGLKKRTGALNGPPKVVGLIALSPTVDLAAVRTALLRNASSVMENTLFGTSTMYASFAAQKQRFSILTSDFNLVSALNVSKLADVLVYVVAVSDVTSAETVIDATGDAILGAIRAQGSPASLGVMQGLASLPPKRASDLKKLCKRFFETEFGADVKVADQGNQIQMLRALVSTQSKVLHWRETRSYVLPSAVSYEADATADYDMSQVDEVGPTGTVKITGYLKGKPLSANQLIHVAGLGTFQMAAILAPVDPYMTPRHASSSSAMTTSEPDMETDEASVVSPVVLAIPDASQASLQFEADENPFASEQTWPTEDDYAYSAPMDQEGEEVAPLPAGVSDYQGIWLNPEDDQSDASSDDGALIMKGDKIDEDDDDEDMGMDLDTDGPQARLEEATEDAAYPDEVDIPITTDARTRLARYRGLKSFRTSPWDPKESLPNDYARLFQFQDFQAIQREVLSAHATIEKALVQGEEATDSGYVAAGTYVTLVLTQVPQALYQARVASSETWLVSSLLTHENRLSVVHFNVNREASYTAPIKSKDPLTFHCGFRSFTARPIFSDSNYAGTKHKFQRFFPQGAWVVASVYAPSMFQPSNVLVTTTDTASLVATGTLHSVDPDRVVLKRIVLTGTPVKVKRRKAVIRYMFRSPMDINWFKPIEMVSKHGLTGHIKESIGTHGDFKCIFNKPIQQHDTVCMFLYKRVYPKRILNADGSVATM